MDSIEELKQEVYSLRNKLATATSQEAWYNDEIAQLQTMRKQESEIQDALKEEVIRLQRKNTAVVIGPETNGNVEMDSSQHQKNFANIEIL
uniref:Uncharacterized protein n=1 Tax=Magallana gigas TaxID=29159 RepID=A0A8W8KBP5_MAGGI